MAETRHVSCHCWPLAGCSHVTLTSGRELPSEMEHPMSSNASATIDRTQVAVAESVRRFMEARFGMSKAPSDGWARVRLDAAC